MTGRQLIHSQSAPERERPDPAGAAGPGLGLHVAKSASGRLERGQSVATSDGAKARKPYTITKQRERWTDAEHARFLEALRLHGRAWRRIEEHIGTKTAVQIRSHAQKFFSKLEREQAAGNTSVLPEDLNIPPPRPKRKPAHPYPRKADPQSGKPLLPAQSGSLPTLASAAAAAAPSLQQQSGSTPTRGISRAPHHLAGSATADNARPSPFSTVQQQVHSGLHHPPASYATSGGGDREQQHPAEGHAAAVAAVAAAASAAAAAAAAAVVADAEAHVQASLQANPPKGFPFFGLPPSMLATMGLQLQSEAQASALERLRLQGQASGALGSLTLAPSLLTPAPSNGGGGHIAHPDAYNLQGLTQSALHQQPHAAALSTLARLACSGGLAGLTAAAAAEAGLPQQASFAGQAPHHGGRGEALPGNEHTATNVPDGRLGVAQATEDGSDELRRGSGKRCSSDGDSACSREHATDARTPQGMAAAAAAAVAAADFTTDPFAAMRVVQGLAAANNRAGWAAASQLPIAALLSVPAVGAGRVANGDVAGTAPAPFAFPLASGIGHAEAPWSGYSASLLSGGLEGAMAQQPKPKRSSGGKGSAFTHAGTMSGPRATVADGAAGKDEPAAAAMLVESRSSHDRLRDSESPCNIVAAPHKCSKAAGNGSHDSQSSELQANYGFGSDEGSNPTGNGSSGEGSNEGGNANGSDDDNKDNTTHARTQGNGTSKAPTVGGVTGQQPAAEPRAGQAHERAAAQTRPQQEMLLHSGSAQTLGVTAGIAGSHAGSGEDGPEGSKGGSDDRRSSCTLPQQAGLGLGAESHYPGPVTATDAKAASAAAAVANSLLSPEAMQMLLAGTGTVAVPEDSGMGGGPLGHTSGAGTMQELLLSLRAAAAAGGGDVQRMFGPLYGDWQAFIKQHQAAAQNLQHQQTGLTHLLPTLSGGGPSGGHPAARHHPLQTVSAGAGTVSGGRAARAAFDSAELRTFSGGFQPYKRSAAHLSHGEDGLKRSISSSRIDVPPRKRLHAGYWENAGQQ